MASAWLAQSSTPSIWSTLSLSLATILIGASAASSSLRIAFRWRCAFSVSNWLPLASNKAHFLSRLPNRTMVLSSRFASEPSPRFGAIFCRTSTVLSPSLIFFFLAATWCLFCFLDRYFRLCLANLNLKTEATRFLSFTSSVLVFSMFSLIILIFVSTPSSKSYAVFRPDLILPFELAVPYQIIVGLGFFSLGFFQARIFPVSDFS